MGSLKVNDLDIKDIAECTSSGSYSKWAHPLFKSNSTPNGPIKNWNSDATKFLLSVSSNIHDNFKELRSDLCRGKLLKSGVASPLVIRGNAPLLQEELDRITGPTGYGQTAERFIYAQRVYEKSRDVYKIIIKDGSGNVLKSKICRTLFIQMCGGGGGGGPTDNAYNGGGGSGGGGCMFWLYIKDIPDMSERFIASYFAGGGGFKAQPRQNSNWGTGSEHGYEKVWSSDDGSASGFSFNVDYNTVLYDGARPRYPLGSWDLLPDGTTGIVKYDPFIYAWGGKGRHHGDQDKTVSGGEAAGRYHMAIPYPGSGPYQGISEDFTVMEDQYIKVRITCRLTGGYGAAKVSKGGVVSTTVGASTYPTIAGASDRTIIYKYGDYGSNGSFTEYTGSADLDNPYGPGWGGSSMMGHGSFIKNSGKAYIEAGYGGGGCGNSVVNWLTKKFKAGTNGGTGLVIITY